MSSSELSCTYIPQSSLSAFVEQFWLYEGPTSVYEKERLLPSGAFEVIINLRENALRVCEGQSHEQCQDVSGSIIHGAHAAYFVLDMTALTSVVGIRFKPGGAFPFLTSPAGDFHNSYVPLETLWGTAVRSLRDQLLEASSPEERFRLLEQALLAQAVHPLTKHPAVSFALQELQIVPSSRMLSELTTDLGLKQQRFIQMFRDEVGLTPKLFYRIQRFHKAFHLLRVGQEVTLADLALTCGYFDQAHLNHDFRTFTGMTPFLYLQHRDSYEQTNHVVHLA